MFNATRHRSVWDVTVAVLAVALGILVVLWAAPARGAESPQPEMSLVVSPWDGVFRTASQAGDAPLVEVGDHVTPQTIVGFIDVDIMQPERKMAVYAGVAGTVVQVLAGEGEFVEAGQPLMAVQLDPPAALNDH